MENELNLKLKEYFWNVFKNITNTFSNLTVNNLGNGYVKCFWEISPIDNLRIRLSKSSFCAIRLFDISNTRSKDKSTCIMKEIQVSQFQSSISFPIPINKGVYYFEFGYRKKNGDWRKLAYDNLNMGYRIKKIIQKFDSSNWFSSQKYLENIEFSPHQKAYKLSLNKSIGGSDEMINNKDI